MQQAPKTLWVVRVRRVAEQQWNAAPIRSDRPLGMEGAFASRDEALAFQSEIEKRAAKSGYVGPLLDVGTVEELLALSAFEPGVFRDWLMDHGIPDPEPFAGEWDREEAPTPLLHWLDALTRQQAADLYAALHHFRFYEVVEVPFVEGHYPEDQWDEWEKNIPHDLPAPEGEYDGFTDEEDGFTAEPGGWPSSGYAPVQTLGGGPWGDNPISLPPAGDAPPSDHNEDDIPF